MITASAAQRMEEVVDKLEQMDRKRVVVPQAYDFIGELTNVRTLLRTDRPAEALERLERAMDRHCAAWRAAPGQWPK